MSAGRPSSAPRVRPPDSRRPVLSARAGAALGVVVVLITILAIPFRQWITQGARIADLESQVAWHTQRVAELKAAQERWKDPAYVEAQARARLHFVRPGEVGYVVLTEEEVAAPETTQTRPMADAPKGGPWWSAVWTTVEQAADPARKSPPPAPAPAQPAESYSQ
ncbi:MAG: septum formation initiator family protein [Candidatus Nanopelagicales bacterium]|nr:septum formation initiator family protein [Candidatus Nanopelagicales bacterium]